MDATAQIIKEGEAHDGIRARGIAGRFEGDGEALSEAEDYWRDITGAWAELFYRPAIKRHNPKTVRYRTGDDYHGCMAIQVLKSADLYRRFEGWWRGIAAAAVVWDVTDLAAESRSSTGPP